MQASALARRRRLRIPAVGLAATLLAVVAAMVVAPAPASAAVPGLVYVTAATGFDSNVYKSVRVFCPAGTQVIGGGYELIGGEGSVVLDDFIPSATSVLVGAGEIVGPGEPADGTTEFWQARATAVCANPLPGYSIVSGSSTFSAGASKSASAFCPSGVPIGAGASLSNGFGQVSINALSIFSTSAAAAAGQDEDGYSGSWSVTVYTICANPLPGLSNVFANSATNSDVTHGATAVCAAGKRPTGGGWQVSQSSGGARQAFNAELFVNGDPAFPNFTVRAAEDANGFSGNWSASVQAICADV
jgi:hypothetical protein